MVAPVVRSKVLFCSLAASFLWCRANVVWASAVEDYLYEFTQMQKTDPNGFYLMVAGVSLIAFLALTIFAGMREEMELSSIPKVFQGTPIALITAGILSLAFMGFSGLVK